MKETIKKLRLWQKILIGLALGVLIGATNPELGIQLEPLGRLFINAIKMLIVPLVFFSIVSGVASMSDPNAMGRMGIRALLYYVVLTMFAISLGLGIGHLLQPGAGVPMQEGLEAMTVPDVSLLETFINIVPTNPIASMAEGKILPVIFFAVMVGLSASLLGKKAEHYVKWNDAIAEIMYKMTGIIMGFAPYGVLALMAWVTSKYGIDVLAPLFMVILGVYLGCLVMIYGVYGLLIKWVAGLNPFRFFKKILDAQMVAFTTCSSSATLPVTIHAAREKLGVSASTANFALPLGATVNMNGSAIYHGVCVMFVAQIVGVDLGAAELMKVVVTSTLVSIGVAGVPGGGLVTLAIVFNAAGLPTEAVALIAGIDRVLDMARTTANVSGDAFVSVLVDQSEKTFDDKIYNTSLEKLA